MTLAEKMRIPTGNTLICLPLNFEDPIRPRIFECKSVNDAFLFIKPSCSIEFKGYGRKLTKEHFFFNSPGDFNIQKICNESNFLNSLVELCLLYFESMNLVVPGNHHEKIDFILDYILTTEEDKLMKCFLLLKKSLVQCVKIFSPTEKSYQEVELFFTNKISEGKTFILNASLDQLCDLDNDRFSSYVNHFIREKFDKLDLRNAISILVIPGFLKYKPVMDKYAKICYNNSVMIFSDLNQFEDTLDKKATISTYNPAAQHLDFCDLYFANVCLSGDQLFVPKAYSFLDIGTMNLSCSTIIAALAPSFILSNTILEMQLGNLSGGIKPVINRGKYKSLFASFSIEKRNSEFFITGDETLYNGDLDFLRSVKQVLLCNWLHKRFTQLINLTIFNQLEISPPGNLQSLQQDLNEKVCKDFYSLCRDDKEKIFPNIEWLLIIPAWIKIVSDESFMNSFQWPVSFTLPIKLKERKGEDDLLLMHIYDSADGMFDYIPGPFDVRYEAVCEDDLVNFAIEIQHEFY